MSDPVTADPKGASGAPSANTQEAKGGAAWPRAVPRFVESTDYLTGDRDALPPWDRLVAQYRARLPAAERRALMGDGPEAIRDAVVVAWQLTIALELAPPAGGATDEEALNALLSDVDRVREALQPLAEEAREGEQKAAVDRLQDALARDAIALAGRVHGAPEPQPITHTQYKPRASGARSAMPGSKSAASSGKGDKAVVEAAPSAKGASAGMPAVSWKVIALALVAVLSLGYAGSTLFGGEKEGSVRVEGMIYYELSGGGLVVRTPKGTPPDAAQQAWLDDKKREGMRVEERGPGVFRLYPKEG